MLGHLLRQNLFPLLFYVGRWPNRIFTITDKKQQSQNLQSENTTLPLAAAPGKRPGLPALLPSDALTFTRIYSLTGFTISPLST